ncbi:cysteine desulfurase family protein [Clostridium sp. Marseille-P299]|uniref:cysteine desulfurase family protein n=1 Tax=Clostridium sp. Marseille-P299 TaxID=1805477 RepID=UPI000834A1E9|nr:cysteine desulfurase family protein [Clostridium sp. Marseille-P299]
MIYLDYAANTPVDALVLDEFVSATTTYIANPNSTHPLGKEAHEKMNEVTKEIATVMGLKTDSPLNDQIIYTSGASEANNLAIKGIARSYRENGKHIISTCLEHSSVSGSLTYLQSHSYEIDLVNILPDGTVDLEHLKELMRKDTVLVSIGYVDSELGVIQPIEEIAKIVSEYPNCFFHTDATQAVGKIPVNLEGVDLLTFTPHKFFGLNGTGVLIKKEGIVLEPLIHGGASTTIYRSGTPVLSQAMALLKALSLANEQYEQRFSYVTDCKNYLMEELKKLPLVQINSPKGSSPYILNLGVKGVKATLFKEELEKHGVCVSIKSACSVVNTPSRPVYAITKDRKRALSSFRISLSHVTTMEEMKEFLQIFNVCYEQLTKQ